MKVVIFHSFWWSGHGKLCFFDHSRSRFQIFRLDQYSEKNKSFVYRFLHVPPCGPPTGKLTKLLGLRKTRKFAPFREILTMYDKQFRF